MPRRHWLPVAAIAGFLVVSATSPQSAEPVLNPEEGPSQEQGTTQEPDQKTAEQTAEDAQNTPAFSAGAESRRDGHDDKAHADGGEDVEQEQRGWVRALDNWIDTNIGGKDGVAQWVMAISGIAAVVISIWGVILLRLTLSETAGAVGAAVEANRIARETAERQLRAYLLPDKAAFMEHPAGNLRVGIAFKNTGQTPAFDVHSRIRCAIIPRSQVGGFPFLDDDLTRFGTVGPSQEYNAQFFQPDGNTFLDWYEGIKKGDSIFFVWGTVTYTDAFDEKQVTRCRFRYAPHNDDFVACDEGNEST